MKVLPYMVGSEPVVTPKREFSFLAVHDGSCFDAIQAIVPSELDNYQS